MKTEHFLAMALGTALLIGNNSTAWAQAGRQALGIWIRDSSSITLNDFHPSGISDPSSTARQNIIDTANCNPATTSAYSDVGVTHPWLHTGMLQCMKNMVTTFGYTYEVTEIAGGDHSTGSYHYAGTAFDVDVINGVPVNSSNPYFQTWMQRCRDQGAIEVLGPGDPDHDTHCHAAWPSGTSASAPGGCIVISPNAVPFSAVCQNQDGSQDFYMVGNNNYAFHNYQVNPNGSWNGFSLTSGSPVLNPGSALARNEDGRLEAFFVGADGNVYHRYQTTANGAWSGYYSMGNAGVGATEVAAGINSDGRLEVFIIGADKHVYHRWQDSANSSWSGGWSQLGGWQMNGGLTVGYNADGRQQVFGWGTDGNCISIWQTAVNGAWGSWTGFGGAPVTSVTCAANQDGRLEVFVTSNGTINHKWQTSPNGSFTASWSSMGWGADRIVAQRNNDGRIELMAVGIPNGYVAHNYQTSANGSWAGFGKLLGQNFVASSLCFGKNQDGRLELFSVGSDTAVWHIWQTSAGGAWNTAGWSSMGGTWRSF